MMWQRIDIQDVILTTTWAMHMHWLNLTIKASNASLVFGYWSVIYNFLLDVAKTEGASANECFPFARQADPTDLFPRSTIQAINSEII